MNIEEFIKLFKAKINELLDLEIIVPSKNSFDYFPGDWTFLFNCTVFDVIKEYNIKNGIQLSICAEPEAEKSPNGRGGYSDILVCSNDKKGKYVAIEHENFPKKTDKLSEVVKKLSMSKANFKLLVTYWYPRPDFSPAQSITKKEIIDELNRLVTKEFPEGEKLYLLIAPYNINKGEQYQFEII